MTDEDNNHDSQADFVGSEPGEWKDLNSSPEELFPDDGESKAETAQCVFCEHRVEPMSKLAKRHICRSCLLETQVGDRVEWA